MTSHNIDIEVADWLRISDFVEKEEQKKEQQKARKAKADAEAQSIADWYSYEGSPGAKLVYSIKCENDKKIQEARSIKIKEWYQTESSFARRVRQGISF